MKIIVRSRIRTKNDIFYWQTSFYNKTVTYVIVRPEIRTRISDVWSAPLNHYTTQTNGDEADLDIFIHNALHFRRLPIKKVNIRRLTEL